MSSLFVRGISEEEKSLIGTGTWNKCFKTFYTHNLLMFVISWSVCPF